MGLEDTQINQRDFTDPSFPFEKKKKEKKTNTQITFALLLILAEIEMKYSYFRETRSHFIIKFPGDEGLAVSKGWLFGAPFLPSLNKSHDERS